jgi:hypothetical protein
MQTRLTADVELGEVFLRHLVLLLAACAVLGACGGLELNPIVNEHRTVRFEQDPTKTVTVVHDLVWEDKSHATEEVRLPAGVYALEGEDGEYWYMRSSVALELREFKSGGKVESRNLRGGLAVGKYSFRAVPGAVYIDGEGTSRVIIWKLGKNFLSREGGDWRRSF